MTTPPDSRAWVGQATITPRRDECRHGEFWTSYVVHDRYGRWRGDYATVAAALTKARRVELEIRHAE